MGNTKPKVKGHAGFRLNVLISLFENASWGNLAAEYERVKNNPSQLQVLTNTVLGQANKTNFDFVDPTTPQSRTEDFDLDHIPSDISILTCGSDVQHDRIELIVLGHSEQNIFVLANLVFYGSTIEQNVWSELDAFLKKKWPHPRLGTIGITATAIDSGGSGTGPESRTQTTYNFCDPRSFRRIFAIKGVPGPRPIWQKSKSKKNILHLVGVDQCKTELLERLASKPFLDERGEPCWEDKGYGRNPTCLRLSASLPESFFEQITSERRYITYHKNRPKIEFRLIAAGVRNRR